MISSEAKERSAIDTKQRTITICYRKIIDYNSKGEWEKLVFNDSFLEFRMQAQYYNQQGKYFTYAELVRNVAGAEKLSFLVSAAVYGYVQQLNEKIPDVLNTVGKQFLRFINFRFEIINSDLRNKTAHQVAINFYSEPLIWYDTIGDLLLVSDGDPVNDEILTDMFTLRPYLTIHSIKKSV